MRQKQFLLAFLAMLLCFAAPSFAQNVAEVDGTPYTTLAEAISKASGKTIILLDDVTENVTISKSLTIDGKGKTYTGTMTGGDNLTITVKNLNFVNAGFAKTKKSSNGNYTFIKCNFDGKSTYYYPISLKGCKKVVVEDCNVKDYYYGFLYVSSSCANVTVKKTVVDNCSNYGVYFASGITNSNFENVTFKNLNNGVIYNNGANRTLNFNGCSMEGVNTPISHTNGTYTITCNLSGANDFGTAKTIDHVNINAQASGGNGLYGDLASVVAAAESGKAVQLLKNATGAGVVINKNITIDFNGKTYSFNKGVGSTGTESNGFQILKGNNVTLKNGTLNVDAEDAAKFYILVQNYANLTVEDMNLDGTNLDKWSTTDGDSYVLSNNSGNVLVKGNTNITANNEGDKAFAFDACTKAGYTAPVVTIETTGRIDGQIENSAKIVIKSGTFTTPLDASWFEAGYSCKNNGDGTYGVAVSAIKIGDKYYETLAAALAAANAGDIITFVADVTEDVTISKAVTIDGADKTYTGKMTLKADATIKNVNFDGKGYNGYAVETRGANYLTIEDCTATNYGYGFVQLASGTALTTVKNVTASNMNYGVKVDYSNAVVLENVYITAGVAAVLNSNHGGKTITIKDSELNILGTWKRNDTTKTTYVFEGANSIDQFVTEANIDAFKLAEGATLAAPEGQTVTAVKAIYKVVYEDGKYTLIPYPVIIGEQGYETLAKAIAEAEAGDVVKLINNVEIANTIAIAKNVTIDGNGKTITYKGADRAIDVPANADAKLDVTINNLTVDCTASYCQRGINYNEDGKFTLDGVTVKGTNVTYALNLPGSADNAEVTIKDSNLSGNIALNVWGENSVINATNTVFTAVDNNTVEGYAAVKLNNDGTTSAEGSVINIDGGKIDVIGTAHEDTEAVSNGTSTGVINISENTVVNGEVVEMVAVIRYANGTSYSFTNLTDAIAKAEAGETVTMIRDVKMSEILTVNKAITLDGNGKTLKSTAGRAINVDNANGATIKNLTINASGERAINVINKATNVTIEKVTATAANYTVNLAASAANAVVAIKASNLTGLNVVNVAAANAHVTVDGTTLVCNDQTSTENYAAIALNKAAVNAKIVATGVTFDIKGDSVKASNGAEGGSITIDGVEAGNKIVAVIEYEGTDNYYSFYTLAEAVAAAQAGETVTLIADATGAGVVIDKDITIDFNGKTYSFNEGVGSTGTKSNGFQILKGNTVTLKNGTLNVAESAKEKFYILVQNYANLTVNGMNLDGTNLDKWSATDGDSYVLSNNCGTVNVIGSTIKANDQGDLAFALDACLKAPYEAPVVNVVQGSTINGNVEVSATLNFAGTLNGKIIINGAEGVVNGAEGLNVTTTIEGRNVVYANGVYTTAEFEPVAEVNGIKYASLREAVEAAPAGATVYLLKDVTLEGGYEDATEGLRIEKAITIKGQDHTINCGKFSKGIRVYNQSGAKSIVSFYNLTIVNNNAAGRCIDTRSGNIDLLLYLSNLEATGTNSQPLTLGGQDKLYRVRLQASSIDAGKSGYGIISFVPSWAGITCSTGTTIKGFAAVYLKEGANGTKLSLDKGTYTATNTFAQNSGVFGAVVVEGDDNIITMTSSLAVVKAVSANGASMAQQAAFLIKEGATGNKITIASGKVVTEGDRACVAMVDSDVVASTTITGKQLVAECGGYQFISVDDALRCADTGDTVKLLADVALDTKKLVAQNDGYATLINVKDKAITLDLNGKTINVEAAAADLANAKGGMLLSVFHADTNGQLTLTDNSEAQTGAVIVKAKDAKIYCLAASESQYTDKSQSGKIIVNGGTYTLDKAADSMFFSDANEVITINGGNFTLGNVGTGSNGMPWIFNTYERNERHVNVNGGTFNADINHQYWAFEVNVPKELALRNNGNDTWTVVNAEAWVLEKYNASYNREVGYATLEEALAVSNNVDNTVTLAKDLTRAGLVINKDITIDFNGKTYTANEGVGSTGTQTLGLQILKDNNVTLKNGTLTSEGDKVKMLVQNYANLTVEDMNLVGTTNAIQYVLSNNSGESHIIGNTNITTDAVAFDVYDYTKAGYAVPTLTVDVEEGAKITGNIEVSESIATNLNVKGGIFTTPILPDWCAQYYVPVDFGNGTYGVECRFLTEVVIYDNDESYSNDKEFTVGELTYVRSFENDQWQTIYLPFAVPAANLIGEFEVAYIYNASYMNSQATIQFVEIEDTDYVLQANYPYLIRAKEEGVKSIVVEGAKLMPTVVAESINCSSVFETFEFIGSYTTMDELPCEVEEVEQGCKKGHFEMDGGNWVELDGINPFRVYLTITLRNGSDFLYPTAQSINMVKVDKNGNVDTSVEKIGVDADILGIYDLQGRRVLEPQKGEIYIINGKKVVF